MIVPTVIQEMLSGWPEIGAFDQAFPFLTVDGVGYPHVCLLSRAELDASDHEVFVVVTSSRTIENLDRFRKACLVVVDADTAHYCKLRLERSVVERPAVAAALRVAEYKADSLGIPLSPLGFEVRPDLSATEDWLRSKRLLNEIRA